MLGMGVGFGRGGGRLNVVLNGLSFKISKLEDVPLVEFLYLVFSRTPGRVTVGDSGLCCCVPCLSTLLFPFVHCFFQNWVCLERCSIVTLGQTSEAFFAFLFVRFVVLLFAMRLCCWDRCCCVHTSIVDAAVILSFVYTPTPPPPPPLPHAAPMRVRVFYNT